MTVHEQTKSALIRSYMLYQYGAKLPDGKFSSTRDLSATKSWLEYRRGGDNPNWRTLVRKAMNATNNYSCYRQVYELGSPELKVRYECALPPLYDPPDPPYVRQTTANGPLMGVMSPSNWANFNVYPASHDSTASNQALERFNQNVNKAMSPVEGLVFLGELTETVKMFRRGALRIFTDTNAYLDMLRSISGTRKRLEYAASLWLEYAFGWMPLFNDLQSAAELLARIEPRIRPVRGTAKVSTCTAGENWEILEPNTGDYKTSPGFNYITRTSTETSCIIKGAIKTSLLQPGYNSSGIAERWGLSCRQFIPTIWELLPYSWIADYFSNLGAVLNGAFFDESVLAWKFRVRKSYREREFTVSKFQFPATVKGGSITQTHSLKSSSSSPGTSRAREEILDRDVPTGSTPSLTLRYPSFGSQKWANLGAFLIQRAKAL